jgi:NAD+ diphosphatase
MAFRALRDLYGRIDEHLWTLAGRAAQLVEWDRTHLHCGRCGTPTEHATGERARRCPVCGHAAFPRLSPAVIVRVTRGDEILLARAQRFPGTMYSVLAGFVEPGESVEETVAREVFEETAIEVQDVRYFGSQPWPYPHSLMLGFTARWRAGEIAVDGTEIEAADWFRADAMPMTFPGNISISQWLIRDFLVRHGRSPR